MVNLEMQILLKDSHAQRVFQLKKGLNQFGKSLLNEFKEDQFLSDEAFQIVWSESGLSLMVLGKDIVKVNQRKVDIAHLQLGDTLEFLGFCFEVHAKEPVSKIQEELVNDEFLNKMNQEWVEFFGAVEELFKTENPTLIFHKLIQILCLRMSAHRGKILLKDPEEEWNWPTDDQNMSLSKIDEALKQNKTVVWNLMSESDLNLSESMVRHRISSLIASPLPASMGYLYLQRQDQNSAFTESDYTLFDAGVRFAASVMHNFRKKIQLEEKVQELTSIQHQSGLIWQSDEMGQLVKMAQKVSILPVPILIQGQTGTGKEVFAKFIHLQSPRRELPFIAVNCGAIPENLIESELFGHKKGSFTGAHEDKKGIFERVSGGTLFLDEVGELPLQMQVKLLRVLQEKKVTPVGSSQEINVDFRLVSATHVDLENAVKNGSFREDLYFRLNLMILTLPPLSERGTDVIILANEFIKQFAIEYGMDLATLSREAEKSLLIHNWRGNVRELRNRIQKALILCSDGVIKSSDLGLDLEAGSGLRPRMSLKEAKDAIEVDYIHKSLNESNGNLTLAGQILGVDRKVLRDMMQKHNIDKKLFKEDLQ